MTACTSGVADERKSCSSNSCVDDLCIRNVRNVIV